MKSYIVLLIVAGLIAGSAAIAQPAPPPNSVPAPVAPAGHIVHLTDADLYALQYASTHIGAACVQDEEACRAQILLNDMTKRVVPELKAEQAQEAATVAAAMAKAKRPK